MISDHLLMIGTMASFVLGCAAAARNGDDDSTSEGDATRPPAGAVPDTPIHVDPVGNRYVEFGDGGQTLGHPRWDMMAHLLDSSPHSCDTQVLSAEYSVETSEGRFASVRIDNSTNGLTVTVGGKLVSATARPGQKPDQGGLPATMSGKIKDGRIQVVLADGTRQVADRLEFKART